MSDWIDLQLAHSLTPVKAPDALWTRVSAGGGAATRKEPRWTAGLRRGVPCAAAAALLLLLVRVTVMELRPPHGEFVTNGPASVERWLAHEKSPTSAARGITTIAAGSCGQCHNL